MKTNSVRGFLTLDIQAGAVNNLPESPEIGLWVVYSSQINVVLYTWSLGLGCQVSGYRVSGLWV